MGFDFTRGAYLHSIRFAYDRYSNNIVDAVAGSSIFNPAPGVSLNFTGGSGFASGPNPQAPQQTKQANMQARYDGTRTWRSAYVSLWRGGEQDRQSDLRRSFWPSSAGGFGHGRGVGSVRGQSGLLPAAPAIP